MNLLILVPCMLVAAVASFLAVLKNMHMFQLNSYRAATHFKWMLGNVSTFWSQLLLLAATPLFWPGSKGASYVLPLVFLALCFLNKPVKQAKKPLVYTSRVKRMLAVVLILNVCVLNLTCLQLRPYGFAPVLLFYVLTPFLPIVVNWINTPIEAGVRRYYINDARKLLKSHPSLIVIGITGSYGKTSVKYYLTTLLKAKYNVLMTPESFNTPMGVVKTIREQLRPTTEIFVCEMGAKRKGEIEEICDIVFPAHGIITSIGEQHLETFKTVDTVIQTKFELAAAVKDKGIVFLNGDNEYIRANLPKQEYRTYGCEKNNDFLAYDIKVTPNGTIFSINCGGEKMESLQTGLIGEHNVTNVAGAVALSIYLGVSPEGIRTQLKKIVSPTHRLQLLKNKGVTIIDDAYNSNPKGCEAALKTLSLFDGYKILLTPGMVELGSKQEECNSQFGVKAAAVCDFVILVGEKQTRPIYDGLLKAGYETDHIFVADSLKEAIAKAYGLETKAPKIILLENDLPDNY